MSCDVKIYAEMLSQPCRSVIAFCEYSQIPYQLIIINLLKGEHETEEFTIMNPFKEIPVLAHGDFYLNESAAIVSYLADAFDVDHEWYPKDLKIRARVNAYLHAHHTLTRKPCRDYFFNCLVGPKYFGCPELPKPDQERLKQNFEEYFKTLDWMLSETGFIARTSTMTIADIFAYSEITQTLVFYIPWILYPRAQAWYNLVGEHPIVLQTHSAIKARIEEGI